MKLLFVKLFLFIAALLLSACSTPGSSSRAYFDSATVESEHGFETLPAFNPALFEPKEVIDFSQITKLTDDQKQDFLRFFHNPKFKLTSPDSRVATYLGLVLDQFTYSINTNTAQETLSSLSGNCLSLTILSTVFAELAGVDIHFQLLDQNPVFSINKNLLVTSDHLRAVLQSSSETADGTWSNQVSYTRIDYFDTAGLVYVDAISLQTQQSLFYSNLAIEYLSENDLDSAFSYARHALKVDINNASALNTIGILHNKRGDTATAEKVYQYGALNYSKAPIFLRNYKNLLEQQGRDLDLYFSLAESNLNDQTHPWEWVRAGQKAYNSGNYKDAESYYEKAIELVPDVPEVYAFAGRASLATGNKYKSKKYFLKAYKLSEHTEGEQLYKGKLLALKNKSR